MATLQPEIDVRSAELLLALTPGIGPRLRKSLVEHFGSTQAVMSAAASDLRAVPGIGQKLSRSIVAARREVDVEAELRDSYYRSLVGQRLRVLAESQEDGRWLGTSCRYATVALPVGVGIEGRFIDAIAAGISGERIIAR